MTHLIAVLGTLLISFSAIFVRLANVPASTSAFLRTAYALPVLALLWWLGRHRDRRSASARWMAFLSGLLLVADLNFWHRAIPLIGAGLSTVLGNTQVVFVGLAAWILYGEKPRRRALLLIPLIILGVVFISGLGQESAYGQRPWLGVAFGALTGITYAAFLLIFRTSNRQLAPAAGPLLDATAGAAAGGLLIGLLAGGIEWAPDWPAWGWLLALALGSQVFGWLLISFALPRLPALETSVLLPMQPVGTLFWGYLIFSESLSALQWLGAGLVLGGIAALSILGSVKREVTPQDAVTARRF